MTVRELASGLQSVVVEAELPHLDPMAAFDHWLRPELLKRWWPQAAENEPRAGGWYHLAWPTQGWHLRGRYTILEPGTMLAFTWQWDHEPAQPLRHVAVEFAARDAGGSVVTVTHALYGDDPAEQEMKASHRDGWFHFLARLAALTA